MKYAMNEGTWRGLSGGNWPEKRRRFETSIRNELLCPLSIRSRSSPSPGAKANTRVMLVYEVLLFVSVAAAHPFATSDDEERGQRGMTWSNFMPGGGMTLWSSATDDFWAPEPERRLSPPAPADGVRGGEPWGSPSSRDHVIGHPVQSGGGFDEKEEATTINANDGSGETPPTAARPFDDERERRPAKPTGKRGYKNQYGDDDDDRRYSGSNASVNAWFPIMFGMMPQDAKTKQNEVANPQEPQDFSEPARTITAIANSVNHANRGLANAHTVLYAGEPSPSFKRFSRSLYRFK